MKRFVILLVIALILNGCGRQATPQPEPNVLPVPTPAPPTPALEQRSISSDRPASSRVFPREEGLYRFNLKEGYTGRGRAIEEEWVTEPGRLVATQGGRPYVSWLWRADGVWRADPKNAEILLRYLPQDLVESTWRQRSGDTWVYFRLRSEAYPNSAWVLTVLNRGERTEWRFGSGQLVSAEDPAHPDAAFIKEGDASPERPVPAERRTAILNAAPMPTGTPAAVEEIAPAQFVKALLAIPGYELREANLDAQAPTVRMVGVFTRTTWFGPELLGTKDEVLLRPSGYGGEGLYTLATLGGQPRLLVQRDGYLELYWVEFHNGTWSAEVAWDLGAKSYSTPATRTRVLPDGRVEVGWEPQADPAKHRRIRHFTMTEKDQVTWLDDTWAPAAGALRRPETPLELLQAFVFAQAYGLQEEAKGYLARPEMASRFPLPDQPKPRYTEPEVGVGRVSVDCKITTGDPPAAGPIPFYALYGEYEGVTLQHGTAQVGKAPDGRLVIESIEFGKRCYDGL